MNDVLRTSIRFPVELMERLKWACLKRKTNQTAAIISGLELWLNQETDEKPTPTNRDGIVPLMDRAEHDLLLICQRAQAANPIIAAKLIEVLKSLGDSNVDAVTVATAEVIAKANELEIATRAVEDLTAQTTRGNRGSTEAPPSHGLARKRN